MHHEGGTMSQTPAFDLEAAHRYFAPHCFNSAWDLIDQPTRGAEEDEAMLLLAMASSWHWSQRPDVTARNRSVGAWQVSRAHALAGRGLEAMRYGHMSLAAGTAEPPFYRGYAHEAVARACMVLGDAQGTGEHLAAAHRLQGEVTDPEEHEMLEKDLKTIE
jgi:hypothetical protein